MLSLHPILLTLAFLTASITALPASKPSSLSPRAATEQWTIPTMNLHMMTRHSGLPGTGDWPESAKYPSTIDFDIHMPNQIAHCHNEFANGTLPDDFAACAGEGGRVGFGMSEYTGLGRRRRELAFVLQVFKFERGPEGLSIFQGEIAITANEPKEPSSYLTCLLGPPFDGLRCKLMGMMSVRKELIISAQSSDNTTISAVR